MKALTTAVICLIFNMTVIAEQNDKQTAKIRYIAIGDSYSIGEGATPEESWPALMTRHLNTQGLHVDLVANPSRTGWTTKDAIDRELPILHDLKPNFASLLIGVNDWVQDVDAETFRKHFVFLVDQILEIVRDKDRLLIVTIPDFGVTPTGPKYARGRNISDGIAGFNKIITDESKKRGLRVVDIFEVSKKMSTDRSLVAADGLHPSAKTYAEWEKVIFPTALELLKR